MGRPRVVIRGKGSARPFAVSDFGEYLLRLSAGRLRPVICYALPTNTKETKINSDPMKKYIAALGLIGALTACNCHTGNRTLEGTNWKLTKMAGIPASALNGEADFFTLYFDAAETTVHGRTNCNRFFGAYELKGDKLELENMGMTRMACPDMEYEDAFVKMLDETDRYAIDGAELTLYDDGRVLAVFEAVDPATVENAAK